MVPSNSSKIGSGLRWLSEQGEYLNTVNGPADLSTIPFLRVWISHSAIKESTAEGLWIVCPFQVRSKCVYQSRVFGWICRDKTYGKGKHDVYLAGKNIDRSKPKRVVVHNRYIFIPSYCIESTRVSSRRTVTELLVAGWKGEAVNSIPSLFDIGRTNNPFKINKLKHTLDGASFLNFNMLTVNVFLRRTFCGREPWNWLISSIFVSLA